MYTGNFMHFSIPMAARVDLKVSRTGPKWSTNNSSNATEPIHETCMKSTVAATGMGMEIEKMENA